MISAHQHSPEIIQAYVNVLRGTHRNYCLSVINKLMSSRQIKDAIEDKYHYYRITQREILEVLKKFEQEKLITKIPNPLSQVKEKKQKKRIQKLYGYGALFELTEKGRAVQNMLLSGGRKQ